MEAVHVLQLLHVVELESRTNAYDSEDERDEMERHVHELLNVPSRGYCLIRHHCCFPENNQVKTVT